MVAEEVLEGEIALSRSGQGGFGYDSVFIPAGREQSLAELKERKVPLKTHRILALEDLCRKLKAAGANIVPRG